MQPIAWDALTQEEQDRNVIVQHITGRELAHKLAGAVPELFADCSYEKRKVALDRALRKKLITTGDFLSFGRACRAAWALSPKSAKEAAEKIRAAG
jgi:hypothetical protein